MTIKDNEQDATSIPFGDDGSMPVSTCTESPTNDISQPVQQTPVQQASQEPDAETPLAESLSRNESAEIHNEQDRRRIEHWKNSVFAVGLVDVTWQDSRKRSDQESHLLASAWVCPLFRATRVGNMAVLMQKMSVQEVPTENGVQRVERPMPTCVVGPYWIVSASITYPLILVVTFFSGVRVVNRHAAWIVIWAVLTMVLLTSLSLVACRNPGIFYRYSQTPDQEWRWNDQARTFRPKSAKYDSDCAVVVDGFDHTCPWTGTAIGRRNMLAFRVFLGSVFLCLILDVIIIANPFPG